MMVEGFTLAFTHMKPYDVGYRLMTANLVILLLWVVLLVKLCYLWRHLNMLIRLILMKVYRGIKDQCKKYHLNTCPNSRGYGWYGSNYGVIATIIGDVPR